MQLSQNKRKVVLGLGNLLFGDEGFGIHALQYMQRGLEAQLAVEWVDGGVLGLNLLPFVETCSHLLVLDAVDAGLAAGELVEIAGEAIPLYNGRKLSEHQVGFQEVLALAWLRGKLPEHLKIIGAQPACFSTGMELSQPLITALPLVVEKAISVLASWNKLEGSQLITDRKFT